MTACLRAPHVLKQNFYCNVFLGISWLGVLEFIVYCTFSTDKYNNVVVHPFTGDPYLLGSGIYSSNNAAIVFLGLYTK